MPDLLEIFRIVLAYPDGVTDHPGVQVAVEGDVLSHTHDVGPSIVEVAAQPGHGQPTPFMPTQLLLRTSA